MHGVSAMTEIAARLNALGEKGKKKNDDEKTY
jgi:hypothetical protein